MKFKAGDMVGIRDTSCVVTIKNYTGNGVYATIGGESEAYCEECLEEICFTNISPNAITPQSFETNDGRFSVKVVDDGTLELTITMLNNCDKGYMEDEEDIIQKIEIDTEELDTIIEILTKAKSINSYNYSSFKIKNGVKK